MNVLDVVSTKTYQNIFNLGYLKTKVKKHGHSLKVIERLINIQDENRNSNLKP